MNFDAETIIISLVTSGIGYIFFAYGRRLNKVPVILCGVALMAFPYVVDGLWPRIAVGAALTAAPFLFKWW